MVAAALGVVFVVTLESPSRECSCSTVDFFLRAGFEAFLDKLIVDAFLDRFLMDAFEVMDLNVVALSEESACGPAPGTDLLGARGAMLRSSALRLKDSKGMLLACDRNLISEYKTAEI